MLDVELDAGLWQRNALVDAQHILRALARFKYRHLVLSSDSRRWNVAFFLSGLLLGLLSAGLAIYFSLKQADETQKSNRMYARSNELSLLSQMQDRQNAADTLLFGPRVGAYVAARQTIPANSPLQEQVVLATGTVNFNAYVIRRAFRDPTAAARNYFLFPVVCSFRRARSVLPTAVFNTGWESGRALLNENQGFECP